MNDSIPLYDPEPQMQRRRQEIDLAISKVLDHGQFILGPEVKQFEKMAAEFIGVKHAIGVNSGTDALVIALRALGIGDGDEVITTPMSFFATAESISQVGAKPVFVDINTDTFNINADGIESKITEKTKAILPVHLFGQPAEMAKIIEIAEKHDLYVLEDCAQSFGARYLGDCLGCSGENCSASFRNVCTGKQTGSLGDVGAFSFFPTKNLGGAGDGGLVTTDDDKIAEMAKALRAHGGMYKYYNEYLGYNSRLDTLQAAILKVKLPYIEESNSHRVTIAEEYSKQLAHVADIKVPEIINGHVFHQYTIRVENRKRDELKQYLKERGISSNIYFPIPQNELPVYKEEGFEHTSISHKAAQEVLSMPIWPYMQIDKARIVSKVITEFFK